MDLLGTKIRANRLEKGIKLTELASRSGFSPSYISQIERNLSTPSVAALNKIATALGEVIGSFFDDASKQDAANSDNIVVRSSMRKSLIYPGSNISHQLLSPDLKRKMEPLWTCIPPGIKSGLFSHQGEEVGIVLRGTMEIQVGDNRYKLEKGDSIYFQSTTPHQWGNCGMGELEVIWVITPPSF